MGPGIFDGLIGACRGGSQPEKDNSLIVPSPHVQSCGDTKSFMVELSSDSVPKNRGDVQSLPVRFLGMVDLIIRLGVET